MTVRENTQFFSRSERFNKTRQNPDDNAILSLNSSKTLGPYGIPPRVLKECAGGKLAISLSSCLSSRPLQTLTLLETCIGYVHLISIVHASIVFKLYCLYSLVICFKGRKIREVKAD